MNTVTFSGPSTDTVLIRFGKQTEYLAECAFWTPKAVFPKYGFATKLFCQQMHSLLKHKMLQFTLQISLYMAPTCFGPFGPSSGSIRRNLAKVTVSLKIIS